MKFGIIGGGFGYDCHYKALLNIEGTEIIGITDSGSENLISKYNEIMEVDLKLGDALLMNLNLIHRSGQNISKRFRLSIIGRYHNMISNDFKSGLTIYKYSDKKYNKKAHESS